LPVAAKVTQVDVISRGDWISIRNILLGKSSNGAFIALPKSAGPQMLKLHESGINLQLVFANCSAQFLGRCCKMLQGPCEIRRFRLRTVFLDGCVPELSFLSRLRARRAKNQWFGWRCA
jgi:hypothetical protein